ncbi:MAG TPA: DNA primase [Acidimicrobiales bacterium]|nr:DNA primase [Acidimicrobiales bacterium]
MGIVDEDIARVRESTDFVAVVGEHLALRRVGSRWVGLCPFHTEKTPSLSVNGELGLYYCFGCGARGDAITFVREVEQLDFVEAVEKLAARAGITLRYDSAEGGRDRQRKNRIHETLEAAVEWYHQRLLSAPDAAAARSYLRRERGYSGDVVRRYRLGWAPQPRDALISGLGRPIGDLVEAGLAVLDASGRHVDFFRGRILFPVFEAGGRPVGFGGRMLPGGYPPKYKNTPATPVYEKSRLLYGLNWAKKSVVERGRVVVCEGYTDVIGLQEAGITEAVATCGTALADGHIRLLTNFARRLVLAYDADAAGQAAAEKFYEWEKRYQVDIRVLALPAGSDPADAARSDPDLLIAAVEEARPYLGFRLERLFARSDLASPEGRSRAAGSAMSMVAEHPDELVRDQYVMQIADRCGVDPERLRSLRAPAASAAAPVDAETPARPPVGGPELEALRMMVHRRDEVAARLAACLFPNPLARGAFELLSATPGVHEAVETADSQTADLLLRLAVEETDAEPDDVVRLLVKRCVEGEVSNLERSLRQAAPADQAQYAQLIAWLTRGLQQLRAEHPDQRPAVAEAEQRLVAWLAERRGGT